MDLVATLKHKIDALDDGDHMPGLRAVLLHIEAAHRHLARGQGSGDDTAFTDAIYRTNQAFEGSVKEAYRVLAGKDPDRTRAYDIEKYLEDKKVFRERVLSQLTNYRTEWRNPSTHDYKLDFDESESFLAIISVAGFACVLIDQIAERLSFISSQKAANENKNELVSNLAKTSRSVLVDRAVGILQQFASSASYGGIAGRLERQYLGALHGFFSSVAPDVEVVVDYKLTPDSGMRADLMITQGKERVIVEIGRYRKKAVQMIIAQVEHYMLISGVSDAIVMLLPEEAGPVSKMEREVPNIKGRLVVLQPQML